MSPIYEQVVRKPASHGPAEMCKERNARLYIASMLVEYKCSEFQTYIQQVGWWKCSMFTILQVNTSVTSLISMYKSDRNNENLQFAHMMIILFFVYQKIWLVNLLLYNTTWDKQEGNLVRFLTVQSMKPYVNWPILPILCPMSHILISDELQGAPLTHRIIFLELIS